MRSNEFAGRSRIFRPLFPREPFVLRTTLGFSSSSGVPRFAGRTALPLEFPGVRVTFQAPMRRNGHDSLWCFWPAPRIRFLALQSVRAIGSSCTEPRHFGGFSSCTPVRPGGYSSGGILACPVVPSPWTSSRGALSFPLPPSSPLTRGALRCFREEWLLPPE